MATRKPEGHRGRRTIQVLTATGTRQPFLRGMVTHDLVQRGLSFDDAYAVARALRDRISDRDEIESAELAALIEAQLGEMFGGERVEKLAAPVRSSTLPQVADATGQAQPFSRGLLARSLLAAGVDADRAYRLVTELQAELLHGRVASLTHRELGAAVGDFLERSEGEAAAARYRMVRRIDRLPRPLVIYLGGATGTGKSTLALELAPLLRIYQISATDTIRQVMRMVFAPAILPGLHRSSFEVVQEARRLQIGDEQTAVLSAFEEQATRVCVGVRAVVERALAENMNIIVEGAHLVPPLVPFADLEGSAYQLMLLLSTLEEEVHRSRFLARGRITSRRAAHYLDHLESIRSIQEYALHQADLHDVPILDTSDPESIVPRSLRLLTGALEQKVPWISRAVEEVDGTPKLLLVIDGLGDRPLRSLGGRTPLQAAHTPTLDRLAAAGVCGSADPVAPGIVPDTASGSLALLGQSPMALKRGPIEALGAGLSLGRGDIALRGNLATLDGDGRIVDRRAGRVRDEAQGLGAALDAADLLGDSESKVRARVEATTEHRLAIVLQGEGLSSAILGSDPGDAAGSVEPLVPRPKDPTDRAAAITAGLLARLEKAARRVLGEHPLNEARRREGLPPANAILSRGAGRIHPLISLAPEGRPLEVSCISGDRTLLGLATWLQARSISEETMTANLDTDLRAKFRIAGKELGGRDLVVVHVKGADIAAHDRRPDLKVEFLERVDAELGRLLKERPTPIRVAVAADHATLSETGEHAADPVPVLISGAGVEPDEVGTFDEFSVVRGRLGRFPLQSLLSRLTAGTV